MLVASNAFLLNLMFPFAHALSATWVLESGMFPQSHAALRKAVIDEGHRLVDWDDEWWYSGIPSNVGAGSNTFFHGSLGNAARIHSELKWMPGSFCDATVFSCSKWYESCRPWLLQSDWRFLPAAEFVDSAADVARTLGCSDKIFVRPDSPLKPFSGRVVDVPSVSLRSLDHGFYYDDNSLPIVVCPVCDVGREWRFVVVQSTVIAGSAYCAETRKAKADESSSDAWFLAQAVATNMPPPAEVYILDVCESNGELKLLELNPFGGADLYACDATVIVEVLTSLVSSS